MSALRAPDHFRIAALRIGGRYPISETAWSVPMPDLIYLALGLAWFALAALAVRVIERM
jgi:hypothetical protein